jgi:hypothetical protein
MPFRLAAPLPSQCSKAKDDYSVEIDTGPSYGMHTGQTIVRIRNDKTCSQQRRFRQTIWFLQTFTKRSLFTESATPPSSLALLLPSITSTFQDRLTHCGSLFMLNIGRGREEPRDFHRSGNVDCVERFKALIPCPSGNHSALTQLLSMLELAPLTDSDLIVCLGSPQAKKFQVESNLAT